MTVLWNHTADIVNLNVNRIFVAYCNSDYRTYLRLILFKEHLPCPPLRRPVKKGEYHEQIEMCSRKNDP